MKVDSKGIAAVLGISEAHIPLLVGSFLEEAVEILERLSAGIEAGDYGEIALHGHSIKGSAGNLRFDAIQEVAKSIELAAKASDGNFDYKSAADKLKTLIADIEL